MKKFIWLDCDGTWIDFYGVPNWLEYLQKEDIFPYKEAKPLVNLSQLAKIIHKLQKKGYSIGIISWTSKNSSVEYHEAVKAAKIKWLKKHLPSVIFDAIYIIPYGTPKSLCGKGILFDDEAKNREEWEKVSGKAFSEKHLIATLKSFCNL